MSYLALARKWRPRAFSQLVGQEHVNKALIKSLDQQRLHHAYLFTGTRGVGKTSVARLMAKALNCEQGISSTPCLQCDTCIAIEQGRFIDLIEIDAASKTRVEDTRDVLENIQYAPTSGRFKIYLIDEVHMLSQHSFNALLKTLEEPPAHVKFLLATTDPQKLPVTVLSRCLQFHLRHIPVDIIKTQLRVILQEESIPCEEEAVHLLARAAQGSMRDALSLLDQAIASVDHALVTSELKAILGYTQQDYALQLLQALSDLNAGQLLACSRQIACEGGYFTYVFDELLDYLHQITIHQNLMDKTSPLLQVSEAIELLAKQFTPEDIQLFYQIALKGREDIHLAPSLLIGFEMTLFRMLTFRPAESVPVPSLACEQPATRTISIPSQRPDMPFPPVRPAIPVKPVAPVAPAAPVNVKPVAAIPVNEVLTKPSHPDNEDWSSILAQLKLTGMALNAATNAEMTGKSNHTVNLRVAKGHQSLFTPSVSDRIAQALSTYYNETIKLAVDYHEMIQASPAQIKQVEKQLNLSHAEASLQNDPFLQQLQQEFTAELVKHSIEPL